jgi:uncharacterized protein
MVEPTRAAWTRSMIRFTALFEDNIWSIPSLRLQDGEERFKVIGMVGEKLFTGVFVWRNDLPRFMSMRRGNDGEERAYRAAG